MSQYEPLWRYVSENGAAKLLLSFSEIEAIVGSPISHAFLNCKKELPAYGYQVGKISMKAQTVSFEKIG